MPAPIRYTKDWQQKADCIIDVRTPLEYAEDHIPGSVNLPVLSDSERAETGTIYKQQSAFAGRRYGAVLVSRNIAAHLEGVLAGKPADWAPLIYCWRGGQRSAAMARVFAEIGWQVSLLEGGYRAYRAAVLENLEVLTASLSPVMLQGATGMAKTRILHQVSRLGGQVLDLEGLACHRGSLLGAEPGVEQPPQRLFESRLLAALSVLDMARPVLIEAESSRIGRLHLPRPLWAAMVAAPRLEVKAPLASRVDFLQRDYPHLMREPGLLGRLIEGMRQRHGHAVCDSWAALLAAEDWPALAAALISTHYDPAYATTAARRQPPLVCLQASSLDDAGIASLASRVMVAMGEVVRRGG